MLTYGVIIDLDKDGYVDVYDFETFLSRYHYLDEKEIQKILNLQNNSNASLYRSGLNSGSGMN